MIAFLRHLIGWIIIIFRSRQDLIFENLALRQQLLVLHTKRPRRRLPTIHKLFWIGLRRLWSHWNESLILVTPRTVVTWHRAGFRLYWKWLSRARHVGGRKPVSEEVRILIFRMAAENPTWGAPRIHGELLKLGFDVSEPTVSRWLRRVPRATDPGQRWLTFLRNHRTAIAAMDFFTVPTITFWRVVLLFRHWTRPTEDFEFQRHTESECCLDRAADARSLAVRTHLSVPAVRSRLKIWQGCNLCRQGHGKPASTDGLAKSLAERSSGTLGW
jgi:hypothetical protein